MYRCLKLISYEIDDLNSDPSKNAEAAELAQAFVDLTLHAREFMPTTVEKQSPDEQPARMELFRKMLEQTAAIGQQLVKAYRENDNAKAEQIMESLNKQRPAGHKEFRNAPAPAKS